MHDWCRHRRQSQDAGQHLLRRSRERILLVRQVGLPGGAAKSGIHKLASAGSLDEAGRFELFQMMGERSGADRKCGAQVGASRAGLCSDVLEDLESARIGEDPRDGAQFTRR